MTFKIDFDYRFDSTNFFTDQVRTVLDEAARLWGEAINDDFETVPAGIEFSFDDPSNGETKQSFAITEPIDDLRIFMGAETPPFGRDTPALGRGGIRGFSANGDALSRRIDDDFRDQGPVTDIEPFAGAMSIDPERNWNLDLNAPADDEHDLLSVVLHEIGHVLGIGQAQIFDDLGAGAAFDGPNARSVNGGDPIPLENDIAHVAQSFQDGAPLMSPQLAKGQRQNITDVDLALLADIGYEIDGFTAQGSQPPIADNGDNVTIFGTIVDDSLDGLGGDDQIQGNAGADDLHGGAGADVIFGQAGNDRLFGGAGDDQLQGGEGNDLLHGGSGRDTLFGGGSGITDDSGTDTFYIAPGDTTSSITRHSVRVEDFTLGTDTLMIDPAFGFAGTGAVFDLAFKPFTDITEFRLTPTTRLQVRHEGQSGTPLTEDDIAIGRPENLNDGTRNTGPVANDDTGTITGDSLDIDVLANDSDADGDGLDLVVTGQPNDGTASVFVTGNGPVIRYTPSDSFDGSDSFTYAVNDGNAGVDNATVTVQDETATPAPAVPESVNLDLIVQANTPETLTLQTGSAVALHGRTGERAIEIPGGAAATGIDAGTTVNLDIARSAATISRDGTTLIVQNSDAKTVAQINASPFVEGALRFSDGGGAVAVENGSIHFGGSTFADGQSRAASDLALDDSATSSSAFSGDNTASVSPDVNMRIVVREGAPETLEVNSGIHARFLGDTADHTIDIAEGGAATGLKAGTTVEFEGASTDFSFARNGTTLVAEDNGGNVVAQLAASPNATGEFRFTDGGAEIGVSNGTIAFGDMAFTRAASATGSELTFQDSLATSDSADSSMALVGTGPASDTDIA